MEGEEKEINIYNIYLKDIRKYGSIDNAKTCEWLKICKEGSPSESKLAKEKIVGTHQRYVLSVAHKYANGNNIMDVINEGNLGLMRAIDDYDINCNVKFTTYAMYWIKKQIIKFITTEEPIVTTSNITKLTTYVPKITQEFWKKNDREPSIEEVQEILLNKYKLNIVKPSDIIPHQMMSIDEKYDDDEDGQEFMEKSLYTTKTASCNVENDIEIRDKKTVIDLILSKLNERDRYIVKSVYGIDEDKKTVSNVANKVRVTNERIRQIVTNTVKNLGKRYHNLKYSF